MRNRDSDGGRDCCYGDTLTLKVSNYHNRILYLFKEINIYFRHLKGKMKVTNTFPETIVYNITPIPQ